MVGSKYIAKPAIILGNELPLRGVAVEMVADEETLPNVEDRT